MGKKLKRPFQTGISSLVTQAKTLRAEHKRRIRLVIKMVLDRASLTEIHPKVQD